MATADTGAQAQAATRRLRVLLRSGVGTSLPRVKADGCITSARLRSDFGPDNFNASDALSNADGVEWKCSKSALILTTCVPNRDVRVSSMN